MTRQMLGHVQLVQGANPAAMDNVIGHRLVAIDRLIQCPYKSILMQPHQRKIKPAALVGGTLRYIRRESGHSSVNSVAVAPEI